MAIEALNLAKEISSITPARAVFASVSVILTMIKVGSFYVGQLQANRSIEDTMMNKEDYVELALTCANVCIALNRGLNGKQLEDLKTSVCKAIKQLTM